MRTIIIGDVHGCVEEARQLLDACEYRTGDEVVFVGDLVGRGPDSKGVIALARRIGARSVLGNHEHAWLGLRETGFRGIHDPELTGKHIRTALTLDEPDWAFLSGLPLWIGLPAHKTLVVHAGLVPAIPLEEQEPDLMLNIRTIRPDGTGSTAAGDGVPWGSLWPGPEQVVFGHHASRGFQRHPFAVGLDTGCVYGGRLTAYVLPERAIVSVPAKRVYYEAGHRRPAARSLL